MRKKYRHLFEEIRSAWQKRFLTQGGLLVGQTQTAFVLALEFDLLPSEQRATIVASLASDIRRRDHHLSTGFIGTPYLLHVLSKAGHIDLAYQLLHQKTPPSWLYPVTQGATTIWERWDGWTKEKRLQRSRYEFIPTTTLLYGAVGRLDVLDRCRHRSRLATSGISTNYFPPTTRRRPHLGQGIVEFPCARPDRKAAGGSKPTSFI